MKGFSDKYIFPLTWKYRVAISNEYLNEPFSVITYIIDGTHISVNEVDGKFKTWYSFKLKKAAVNTVVNIILYNLNFNKYIRLLVQ